MVTRAIARKNTGTGNSGSLPDTVVCGSHATLRVFNDGSFRHRSWCSAQVMLEERTCFGFLLLLGGHVETTICVLWRDTPVYLAVSACVRV